MSLADLLSGAAAAALPASAEGWPEPLLAGLPRPAFTLGEADGRERAAYRRLRRATFVDEQGLFSAAGDADAVDDDPRAVVLVARAPDGVVLGGVRLAPVTEPDLGWWAGSRLAVRDDARTGAGRGAGVGAALVRAACARAESEGVLRFEAHVQTRHLPLFTRLGWDHLADTQLHDRPHAWVRWPNHRFATQAAVKAPLGALLAGLSLGGGGWVGDDGAPVPGSDLVAACDAIVPSLVEREPRWAGWCGVLVNVNDLAAMGATPVGLLDAVGARSAAAAAEVIAGLRDASQAYGVPVLGGHTQLDVPAALSVTALGRAEHPVPAGGGRAGDRVALTVDLHGRWRPGHTGRQWDSTSSRRGEDLRRLLGTLVRTPSAAAKDVSMAGLVGTLGMLAEASGCAAELEVALVPRPAAARVGDWLACFPGFGLLTADRPGTPLPDGGPATSAGCGRLSAGAGVTLRWPDGEHTPGVGGAVTGLGVA